MITCPSCNHQNEAGSSFCENCGHDMRTMAPKAPALGMPPAGGGTACSNCGFSNIPGAAFCENCGNPLSQVRPAPQVPTPAAAQPTPAPTGGQQVCPNCSHQNVPGSVFCENCGSEIGSVLPPAAVPSAPSVAPPVIPSQQPPAPVPVGQLCTQCGHSNPQGAPFCESCGIQLGKVQAAPPAYSPAVPVQTPSPVPTPEPSPTYLTGYLVIQPSGASITIPPGKTEAVIGREDPVSGIFPEIDLDPHGGHDGGVGRKHARLFIQGKQVMIEDQDSVNGTLLNKQKLVAFQPQPVTDGVELRFGKIVTIYHAS